MFVRSVLVFIFLLNQYMKRCDFGCERTESKFACVRARGLDFEVVDCVGYDVRS